MQQFELISEATVLELNCLARWYRHRKTGAEVLSVINDDENKVFGITLKTPPSDSTGIAHILEHSVLCGSRKYPLKDPFVQLLKGSLQTFLNAFTYPDRTCYPVASQNLQDFYNLVDVYLDAVFYPRLTRETFMQEGWHYELEKTGGPLSIHGVVYNEMKGAYSSVDAVIYEYSQHSLFPDTTYGLDSGGDPERIPQLSFEDFQTFHRQFYHPSNARFFFSGNDDPTARLSILDTYLSDFEHLHIDSGVPIQNGWEPPQNITKEFAISDEQAGEKKFAVTFNWLWPRSTDQQLHLSLQLLAHMLVSTEASPLRRALIDSNLGEDLAGVGFEGELQQMYFSTGLKGISEDQLPAVQAIMDETLRDLAIQGFDKDTVEMAVNTMEFQLRENNTGSYPRGLALMLRALNGWLYGINPTEAIHFEAVLNQTKSIIRDTPGYFKDLLNQYLLENPNRTRVVFKPNPEYDSIKRKRLEAKLANTLEAYSDEEKARLIIETDQLKALQEKPDSEEALQSIPSLTLDDLDKANKPIPLELKSAAHRPIVFHDLFTNGIVYLDLGFNLHALSMDELAYAAVIGRVLTELGTRTMSHIELAQTIGRKTGGISVSFMTLSALETEGDALWFMVRGKCMPHQIQDMTDLYRSVVMELDLENKELLLRLLREEKAAFEDSIVSEGHRIAGNRLNAMYSASAYCHERMSGLIHFDFLKDLLKCIEYDWDSVCRKLKEVQQKLFQQKHILCNVTTDAGTYTSMEASLKALLSAFPEEESCMHRHQATLKAEHSLFSIPSQVNYVGKACRLFDRAEMVNGSFLVVSRYLRTAWLWEQVRVLGGAYGAFCNLGQISGTFSMISYRDPHIDRTLEVYDKTRHYLSTIHLATEELTRAITGTIGDLDAYRLPDAKGYMSLSRYLSGIDESYLQRIREEVLATDQKDFRHFAELMEPFEKEGRTVLLGSPSDIERSTYFGHQAMDLTRIII